MISVSLTCEYYLNAFERLEDYPTWCVLDQSEKVEYEPFCYETVATVSVWKTNCLWGNFYTRKWKNLRCVEWTFYKKKAVERGLRGWLKGRGHEAKNDREREVRGRSRLLESLLIMDHGWSLSHVDLRCILCEDIAIVRRLYGLMDWSGNVKGRVCYQVVSRMNKL